MRDLLMLDGGRAGAGGPEHGARPRHPRRAAAPAPPRAGASASCRASRCIQLLDRPPRLAPARPRPRFRGAAPLLRGRRHAHHRLVGDGAAAAARMSASTPRSATAGAAAGRPAHVDVLRQPARHEVGGRRRGRGARGLARDLAGRPRRRHRLLRAGHGRDPPRGARRGAYGIIRPRWSARTGVCRRTAPPADPALLNAGACAARRASPTHDWLVCLISDAAGADAETVRLVTRDHRAQRRARRSSSTIRWRQQLPDIGRAVLAEGDRQIEVDLSGPRPAAALRRRASPSGGRPGRRFSLHRAIPVLPIAHRPRCRRPASRAPGPAPGAPDGAAA